MYAIMHIWPTPSIIPGTKSPTKRAPTDTDVRPANMTAGMEGGMTGPWMAAVAVRAVAKFLS